MIIQLGNLITDTSSIARKDAVNGGRADISHWDIDWGNICIQTPDWVRHVKECTCAGLDA